MKFDKKFLIIFIIFDAAIFLTLAIVLSMNKNYEEGEEIEDNGNLITVIGSERIDPGSATMDGDYFIIKLKYIVPDGPKLGTQPELFRLQNADGDLTRLEEVSVRFDDLVWQNVDPVKDYDGLLYLVRVESADSDDIEYKVRLRPEA